MGATFKASQYLIPRSLFLNKVLNQNNLSMTFLLVDFGILKVHALGPSLAWAMANLDKLIREMAE